MLYIIFNHIETYTKLSQSYSKVIFEKTNYQNMFFDLLKHEELSCFFIDEMIVYCILHMILSIHLQ
jgi:hypothetical protein